MAPAILKLVNYAGSTHIQETPIFFISSLLVGWVNGTFYHLRGTSKVAETTDTLTHTQQETMKTPNQLGEGRKGNKYLYREEREKVPIPGGKGRSSYTGRKWNKYRTYTGRKGNRYLYQLENRKSENKFFLTNITICKFCCHNLTEQVGTVVLWTWKNY